MLQLAGPFYWQYETSGRLVNAMMALAESWVNCNAPSLTTEQISLVRAYLTQWITAPCWDRIHFATEMAELEESVKALQSPDDISQWLDKALKIGIDPL